MNIKSLLIGSAAVITAGVAGATGAQAADAVMMAPEPEPMNYVRVCDVYGAGFFYIPGTETCLKLSGFVWYQVGAGGADDAYSAANPTGTDSGTYHGINSDNYQKYIRARINFDARSETEMGTLQSYIRLQSDYVNYAPTKDGGTDPNLGLDQAWLSLGGLRMGYSESAFVATPNAPGTNFGSHSWTGLSYSYQQRMFVQYNFTGGNGFFATLSLESDDGYGNTGTGNYVPDIVGKAGVSQGWGALYAIVGYDESTDDYIGKADGDGEFGVKGGLTLNVPNSPGSSLIVQGFYASDINDYAAGSEWSVLASYYQQFTPDFGASIGGQYFSDTNYEAAGSPDAWQAELNLVWTPVQDFEVRTEIGYSKMDRTIAPYDDLDGSLSGWVRFTRYFGG